MKRRDFIALLGSAAAGWPLTARAQPAVPVIGFLSSRSPDESADLVEAFRGGVKEGGFVEGQNVTMDFRWARGANATARLHQYSWLWSFVAACCPCTAAFDASNWGA
jgi:hypothetical protein